MLRIFVTAQFLVAVNVGVLDSPRYYYFLPFYVGSGLYMVLFCLFSIPIVVTGVKNICLKRKPYLAKTEYANLYFNFYYLLTILLIASGTVSLVRSSSIIPIYALLGLYVLKDIVFASVGYKNREQLLNYLNGRVVRNDQIQASRSDKANASQLDSTPVEQNDRFNNSNFKLLSGTLSKNEPDKRNPKRNKISSKPQSEIPWWKQSKKPRLFSAKSNQKTMIMTGEPAKISSFAGKGGSDGSKQTEEENFSKYRHQGMHFDCYHEPDAANEPMVEGIEDMKHIHGEEWKSCYIFPRCFSEDPKDEVDLKTKTCLSCQSYFPNSIFMPCGHGGMCLPCALRISTKRQACPFCSTVRRSLLTIRSQASY